MTPSPLASFVADVEPLLDDPDAIGARLRALLRQDGWLPAAERLLHGDACRQHVLHVSPNRRLSVVALARLPGCGHALVHEDDGAWCVTGVYRGCERVTRHRVVERGGRRSLAELAGFEARAGHVEVIRPAEGLLRTTAATGDGPAISVHVRGAAVARRAPSSARAPADRDVRRTLVTPRVIEVTRAGRPWTHPTSLGAGALCR